jgi:hypothetical protein
MEVLASMFVICIGLLGVLAVIPYGAYQTAKARNAENTSWILDAAVKELEATGMAKPENWKIMPSGGGRIELQTNSVISPSNDTGNPPSPPTIYYNNTGTSDQWLNCSRYFMVDPFDSAGTPDPSNHIYKVGVHFDNRPIFCNRMTGQDDLVYTTHSDKRTDFSGQGNKILSSGQYTCFFMFRPEPTTTYLASSPSNLNGVPWTNIENNVNIDILGCYNRVPGNERTVYAHIVGSAGSDDYDEMLNGAAITFRSSSAEDLDLSQTKYIFISWVGSWDSSSNRFYIEGVWGKIVNATNIVTESIVVDVYTPTAIPTTYKRTVFVTGNLPNNNYFPKPPAEPNRTAVYGLIIPGVMYHKRVTATIR